MSSVVKLPIPLHLRANGQECADCGRRLELEHGYRVGGPRRLICASCWVAPRFPALWSRSAEHAALLKVVIS